MQIMAHHRVYCDAGSTKMRRNNDKAGRFPVSRAKNHHPHSLRWDRPRAAPMPGKYDGRQLNRMLPGPPPHPAMQVERK